MTYRIEITPAARRDLGRLPPEILRRVDAHLLALAANPFPPGAKRLAGSLGVLRIRMGDYRILYRVERQRLVVLVIRVRHRKEVYRSLP